MACRISELVLGCRDPELLARFWCEVLDFVVLDREEDGSLEIGPRAGFGGPQPTIFLSRQEVPEPGSPRLHLDVNATDRDQDAELERLLSLGARPADVGQTGQESWHVLADPEGNAFCLLRTRLAPLPASSGAAAPEQPAG
jgi:catechol 2,3-dioxygenase-like lactoylglutathione lyase family enzyme